MASSPRAIVMVSSSIYGMQNLLNQVYAVLKGYGYTVWMSHKGTIPIDSSKSNFDNCLDAVDNCNVFLGIITGRYGTGQVAGQLSITHQEAQRAILRDKPRFFLVHRDVTIARDLLRQYRFDKDGNRLPLAFRRTGVLDDLRILDLYDEVVKDAEPLPERRGNWAQPYFYEPDVLQFLRTQFADVDRIQAMLTITEDAAKTADPKTDGNPKTEDGESDANGDDNASTS